MIADEEGRDLLAGLGRLDHGLDEVVVGIAFIGKPPAVAHHRDHAGLGAVDEMRHHALRAVLARGERHRHPGRGIRQTVLDMSADAFRKEVRGWLDANATRKSDDRASFRARNDTGNYPGGCEDDEFKYDREGSAAALNE